MGRRYVSIRFGNTHYYGLIVEESKRGLKIIEQRRWEINPNNLSENGFDRDALRALCANSNAQEYLVVMPHNEVITGILEFPLTDRKKIENALTFELENETNESPDNLIFDYRVVNNKEGKTQVVYYATKKENIRTIIAEFSAIGIDPVFLLAQQNLYSGLYKSVFERGAQKNVKLFLDVSDNILTLTFLDSEGISFGRVFEFQDIYEDRDGIKHFILSTIQYYRIRTKREVMESYIISSEEMSLIFSEMLKNDIGLGVVSKLSFKDVELNNIESEFGLLYSAINGRIELTRRQLINFRKNEFVYRGEYDFLKRQLIRYGVALTLILLLAIGLTVYKFRMLSKYDEQLNSYLAEVTKQILGKPYDNFTTALAVIKSKTEPKNLSIPANSAFDYFMFLSDAFPQEIDVNIRVLEIGDKKIRIEAETDSFESVDRVVNSLKKNSCLKDITKGKVKKSPDGKKIDFDLSITPSC
ncbi:MAG: hypothetical protein N2746_01975 [Deltaproteobacteria bacterium]|nr:hypothetical protein [Deltaproteobacteria bacterium]